MKKSFFIKFVSLGLLLCIAVSSAGCAGQNSSSYIYKKQSEKNLRFVSSSKELDKFLNDYYERHSRRSADTAINDMQLGTAGSSWRAWEAMSLLWFDSTNKNFRQNSFDLIKKALYSETVDDFGYAWTEPDTVEKSDEDPTANTFGMGWPFPNYGGGESYDWEFNSYANTEGWTVKSDGLTQSTVQNGLFANKISGAGYISFSKNPQKENIYTEESPFLEFDLRWVLNFENIDGIYISWKNKNEDKIHTVNALDYSVLNIDYSSVLNRHFYLAMYLNENWGTDKTVTDLTVTVKAKSGKRISGDVNLNFVRGNYDSRQIDNGYAYLEAARLYYEFTGDVEFLERVLGKCSKITAFMVYNLDGKSGLADLSRFVGHDGGTINDGVAHTVASSYWDVISMPPKSLYAQILYYRTLQNMIYLKDAAKQAKISVSAETVRLFDGGTADCEISVKELRKYCAEVKKAVTKNVDAKSKTGYFDKNKGRFIEGFNMHGDAVDYGSTVLNDMALWAGLATKEQSKEITSWINGDRTVKTDDAVGHTGKDGKCGIYDYEFAPRTTTVKNSEQYTAGHAPEAGYPYGSSCQDGGAIAFTSYYDIMARLNARGADDAFERLDDIKKWYLDVYDYSAKSFGSKQFYRAYYSQKGIALQGSGTAGALGLDSEFLENSILYAVVPFGFFGLKSKSRNTLSVTPDMPQKLKFWRMENLMFSNVVYDLEIGSNYAIIESVRGKTDGLKITLNLKTSKNHPKVYINGKRLNASDYSVSGGRVTVVTDFCAQKITVK